MVSTDRFQLGPECVRLVAEVAATLARRSEDQSTHVLEVTTYFPLDVDSVGRILESIEEDDGVKRIQDRSICYYTFEEPDHYSLRELDLEGGEHLREAEGLESTLNALKADEDWSRKVREQHEILKIAAGSSDETVELSYFTSRTELPSAKIQSILNDFGAEGHIELHYDEDSDTLSYTFPRFDYPEPRFDRNMEIQEQAEPTSNGRSVWGVVVLAALVLLIIVAFLRLSL